jgi:hypothetical protein
MDVTRIAVLMQPVHRVDRQGVLRPPSLLHPRRDQHGGLALLRHPLNTHEEAESMTRSHDHDLDGTLHDGCPECGRINALAGSVARENQADQMTERYVRGAEAERRRKHAKRGSG